VWADEPTGALDTETSRQVMDLLCRMNEEHEQTFEDSLTGRTTRRATFDGASYVLVLDGPWQGYWLLLSDAVRLADG
jgi:ABC-type transport system involved in cytochrome bd biosynthesis fused ATPase/permease subunit